MDTVWLCGKSEGKHNMSIADSQQNLAKNNG